MKMFKRISPKRFKKKEKKKENENLLYLHISASYIPIQTYFPPTSQHIYLNLINFNLYERMYVVYKSYFPYKNILWYICILMMVSVVNKNYTLTKIKK